MTVREGTGRNEDMQNNRGWTAAEIPDQAGRVAVITGSNSGIGFEAARALASKNAHVVLAVRNVQKGQSAQEAILGEYPQAQVDVAELDLARQQSVHEFAQQFSQQFAHRTAENTASTPARQAGAGARLDLLINNAGVMASPYVRTEDGFELQFATNHLGHFTLTALLLPYLAATENARVVTVSSTVHKGIRLDFDNLDASQGYGRWQAYRYSKLANLYFAYELQRRLDAGEMGVRSVACHPGYTATQLQNGGMMMDGGPVHAWIIKTMNNLFAQEPEMGALPTLYAAVAPAIQGGEYIGPDRLFGTWGHPVEVKSSKASYDEAAARRLWAHSEALTGVTYELPALHRVETA